MRIFFDDKALEELYYDGFTLDKKYNRLQAGIVKQYVKVVNYMMAATRIEDLYRVNSLHYAKKTGDWNGQEYVRINDKYRLRFISYSDHEERIVINIKLLEISKHYE